ncbi:hypothetical protein WICPIJ_001038 [Wickerhamomyces pijperi]|uniref:DUF4110 domain-containing protein n=1 Tax=Wickerhamomyces pijperi TaxID=599730 RepID=A0A9P8TR04_WICPI|nr:hypothetical protein WICPIJ_001038 [Wickerhamomyces pijperi]
MNRTTTDIIKSIRAELLVLAENKNKNIISIQLKYTSLYLNSGVPLFQLTPIFMAKKQSKSDKEAKKLRMAEKAKKATAKAAKSGKKKAKKLGDVDSEAEEDEDIDTILSNFQKEQELYQSVTVSICDRPSRRINSSMIGNPIHTKRELLMFGGENTTNGSTHFYNDLFTFSPDSATWRKITSQNSPTHRSSAAIAGHPSGIVILHGGEFSSPKQGSFYHYSDTWILDCESKEWTKIESRQGPSARSGHRIATWKNYFILFGGFRDLGSSTTYLNDVWCFDVLSYKWKQIEFPSTMAQPDSRSGHSLVPCLDGAVLWGGYTKVKAGKGLQKGKILSDLWVLKMRSDLTGVRWERRRKVGYQPSARVGCSMVSHKGRGVLFGGVYDYEETEEGLESLFYNDLITLQVEDNRWYSLSLRSGKGQAQKVRLNKKKGKSGRDEDLEAILNGLLKKANISDDTEDEENADDEEIEKELRKMDYDEEEEKEEEESVCYQIVNKLPHPRFNASTAVVDDTLFIFGGVWEKGEKDYSIDSFYSVDLAKLDGMKMYWEDLQDVEAAKIELDSDEEEEDDDEDDDEDEDDEDEIRDQKLVAEEEEDEEEEESVADEPEIPDQRPWLPHPKAFETLRDFYVRTGASFLEWSISNARGEVKGAKHLKRKAFDLCQDRWWERREQVRLEEDKLEELGVEAVVERDTTAKAGKRR